MDFLTKEKLNLALTSEGVFNLLPKRKRDSHKGSYGKAAIMAGSIEYTGAAFLSAAACLRSGAGYTALFVPSEILSHYILKVPEILLKTSNEGSRYAFKEEIMGKLREYDAVAYGMGMGVSVDVAEGAAWLLSHYQGKLILDADGLNSLSVYKKEGFSSLLKNAKCDVILTPHIKEFSRVSGLPVEEILQDEIGCARAFAESNSVTLLLKNAASVITDGEKTAVNSTGNSGQAKAGSGDVLSGVLAGLCAQGASGFDGACAAAFLCGKAAELAAKSVGEYSLTATDCIARLGEAFLSVLGRA
ncbi:MAG: NAD(P)H-hydrate dehydratase [Clostridia bacterium]|nr:NAD(P)H-hydrate dehydratase [Clostridia bacterium]